MTLDMTLDGGDDESAKTYIVGQALAWQFFSSRLLAWRLGGFLAVWVVVRFFVRLGAHSIKFRDHPSPASLTVLTISSAGSPMCNRIVKHHF